jgi:hypothetical protein
MCSGSEIPHPANRLHARSADKRVGSGRLQDLSVGTRYLFLTQRYRLLLADIYEKAERRDRNLALAIINQPVLSYYFPLLVNTLVGFGIAERSLDRDHPMSAITDDGWQLIQLCWELSEIDYSD